MENCDMEFLTKGALDRHKREDHAQTYICIHPTCGKMFANEGNLLRHVPCHTLGADGPFTCGICGRGFQFRSQFTAHLKSHDKNAPKYKCPVGTCGKEFIYIGDLKRHQAIHEQEAKGTLLKCKVAGCDYKGTYSKKLLDQHNRENHEEQAEIKCACGKVFRKRSTFCKHRKVKGPNDHYRVD